MVPAGLVLRGLLKVQELHQVVPQTYRHQSCGIVRQRAVEAKGDLVPVPQLLTVGALYRQINELRGQPRRRDTGQAVEEVPDRIAERRTHVVNLVHRGVRVHPLRGIPHRVDERGA